MTLEEISVSFIGDTSSFAAAVAQASALIASAAAQADALANSFTAAGEHAGDGLSRGILSRKSAVVAAANAVAQAAANALRSALKVHSPSKITYEVGSFFDQGLVGGISAGAAQVEKEAAALGQTAAGALDIKDVPLPGFPSLSPFSAPAREETAAPAPISLTIPLEIDGYRLGVAVIENINRVTQGTGRVELSL